MQFGIVQAMIGLKNTTAELGSWIYIQISEVLIV